ncbi:MAG: DMT family transporter [Candidatus Binatia bacterium]
MNRGAPILVAFAAAALFGAATPASKLLLAELPPFQLAGLLYLGAALATLPWVVGDRRGRLGRLDRANRRRLLGAVALGGLVAPVLLLTGLRTTSAASVSLLLNLEMAATAVLGALLFHEPIGRLGWVSVSGIVAAGAVLSGGDWPGVAAALLVAAACLCWGLDNHLTALIDGITPAVSTFCKGAVAGSVNLAIGVAVAPLTAAPGQIAAALVVGAFAYGVSIALYIRAAQQLGAVRAQAVFASAPFVGAALAFGFLDEPLEPRIVIATVLLLGSAALLFRGVHGHAHRHAAVAHLHSHRHDDDHHLHEHATVPAAARHSHTHRHDELVHAHPHWPDLHHRHEHE